MTQDEQDPLEEKPPMDSITKALEGDNEYVKQLAIAAMEAMGGTGGQDEANLNIQKEYLQKLASNAGSKPTHDKTLPGIWWKWLLAASGVMILFGFMMLLFNASLLEPLNKEAYDAFFDGSPFNNLSINERAYQNWVFGVLGAILVGWGLLISFIIYYPFRKSEKWAWNSLVMSLIVWYLLDTLTSIYYGVMFNVLSNTGFLILFGIPLIFSKKFFR